MLELGGVLHGQGLVFEGGGCGRLLLRWGRAKGVVLVYFVVIFLHSLDSTALCPLQRYFIRQNSQQKYCPDDTRDNWK